MKNEEILKRVDALIVVQEKALKETREIKRMLESQTEDLGEIAPSKKQEAEVFKPNCYVPIARWLLSGGKQRIEGYDDMTWIERSVALTEMVGWDVDDHQIRRAIRRIEYPNRRKGQ